MPDPKSITWSIKPQHLRHGEPFDVKPGEEANAWEVFADGQRVAEFAVEELANEYVAWKNRPGCPYGVGGPPLAGDR